MFQLKMLTNLFSPYYFSTSLNSTSEFSFCWLDWVLVVGIVSSLLDFRLSTRKNEWWKSDFCPDLPQCDLPRTRVHLRPDARIHDLDFSLFTRKNEWWKSDFCPDLPHCDLPRTHVHSRPDVRIHDLDFRLSSRKNEWWKSDFCPDLPQCDLPRTRLNSTQCVIPESTHSTQCVIRIFFVNSSVHQ